jgi:hypothetical protein
MSSDEGGETAAMPVTNGELHPATADTPLPIFGKRKRVSSPDETPGQDSAPPTVPAQEKQELNQTLRYLLQILAKDDEDIQLFKSSLISSPAKPRSKRAKLADDGDKTASVESRVTSGHYNSMQDFLDDVERASSVIIDRQQSRHGDQDGATRISEWTSRISALKRRMNILLLQSSYYNGSIVKSEPSETTDTSVEPNASSKCIRDNKMVLTLFGNPSNPKQLFSSLQQPTKVPLKSNTPDHLEIQTPLRENALPNGISATKVVPVNLALNETKVTKTFGELFAPRPTLPQLEPPRRTRSWSGDWIDPFEAATHGRTHPVEKGNYCFSSLPSVQWLQYGGITSSPSYWNRRQKQHSTENDIKQKQQENSSLATDNHSALLQSVYSSFAPTFDSSGSIVQADSKRMVWWAKRGAKRFQALLSSQYMTTGGEMKSQDLPGGLLEDLDESVLEEAIKSYQPEDLSGEISDATKLEDVDSKDTDDILREISELLETLNSYRQIHNLDIPSSSPQNESSADIGTPSTPSSAEKTLYETLKASLIAIVANLPPYAVAKLDGEQLAALNISQRLIIEGPDYGGTMEEDDFTAQQKRIAVVTPAARTVAPNLASSGRAGSFQASQAATGYNQRLHTPNSRTPQPSGGYQATQQYYGARHSSTASSYAPGNNPPNYAGARPQASLSQRPSYAAPYAQHGSQYNHAGSLQQFQRPTQNGYTPYTPQQGHATPQGSPQPYAQRPAQSGYQQPTSYGAARSASPQKQPGYGTPQSRTPYVSTNSSNPPRLFPHQQQPPQYGNYPTSQTPTSSSNYSNSAAAATYARSAAEQATLMDRNKAQLAANQQRQSSNTPNPPTSQPPPPRPSNELNGSQERSLSPGNKQNGTLASLSTNQ